MATKRWRIVFGQGIQVKSYVNRVQEVIYRGENSFNFERVLAAPDKAMADQIGAAMLGEHIADADWSHLQRLLDRKRLACSDKQSASEKIDIPLDKDYEWILTEVVSVTETTDPLTLGVCGHLGIPNDQHTWDRGALKKLDWGEWYNGTQPVWVRYHATYTRRDRVEINGHTLPVQVTNLPHDHRAGISGFIQGSWKSYDEAVAAQRAAEQKAAEAEEMVTQT